MAAARQKLMKLSITVVATNTLIAGRVPQIRRYKIRIPRVGSHICQVSLLQPDALNAANALTFRFRSFGCSRRTGPHSGPSQKCSGER